MLSSLQIYWILIFCSAVVELGFCIFIVIREIEHAPAVGYYVRRAVLFCAVCFLIQHTCYMLSLGDSIENIPFALLVVSDTARGIQVIGAHAGMYKSMHQISETASNLLQISDQTSLNVMKYLLIGSIVVESLLFIIVFLLRAIHDQFGYTAIFETVGIISFLLFIIIIWPNLFKLHRRVHDLLSLDCDDAEKVRLETIASRLRVLVISCALFSIFCATAISFQIIRVAGTYRRFYDATYRDFNRFREIDWNELVISVIFAVLIWACWPSTNAFFTLSPTKAEYSSLAVDQQVEGAARLHTSAGTHPILTRSSMTDASFTVATSLGGLDEVGDGVILRSASSNMSSMDICMES